MSIVAYGAGVPLVLGKVFGGVSHEETRELPYGFDSIFNTIPKVVHGRFATIVSNHLAGRIVEANYESGRIVSKQQFWGAITTFNLTRIDDSTTRVRIQYSLSYPFDFGSSRTTDLIFTFLSAGLTGKHVSVNKPWLFLLVCLGGLCCPI